MDRTLPSEGRDVGSTPAESIFCKKRFGAKEVMQVRFLLGGLLKKVGGIPVEDITKPFL